MIGSRIRSIDHPAAWRTGELGAKDDFAIDLDARHLRALDAALGRASDAGVELESLDESSFPLTDIAGDIAAWRHEVANGRGFVLLRGLPVDRYDVDDVGRLFFGLGAHFGNAVSQSNLGDKLGHVRNFGGDDRRERAYRNRRQLALHTDRCDYIGMLCIRPARSGGVSGYASALTIHNEIVATRPELIEPLYSGYHLHRFGEQPPGEPPITNSPVPVFSSAGGCFNVVYIRGYIDLAVDEGLCTLSDRAREALDYFDEVANRPDVRLDMLLEPGEATITNNCLLLHRRTSFEDHEDPALKRHLLRLWLMDPSRPATDAVRAHKTQRGIEKLDGRDTYYRGQGFSKKNASPVDVKGH